LSNNLCVLTVVICPTSPCLFAVSDLGQTPARFSGTSGLLRYKLEISTIDKFQGMEKRIVLLLPTIPAQSGPGFCTDPARLCVAVTRHVEILLVIGDRMMGRTKGGRQRQEDGSSESHKDSCKQ
jgi:hypothetical protein